MDPLRPLPPLPALQRTSNTESETPPKHRSLLSWATVLAVLSAIALGIVHGVGSKLVDEVWPVIRPLFGL